MNRAAKRYLRQVKKHLYCPGSIKKKFLSQLEDELLRFCGSQETVTFPQLCGRFGQPCCVASEFLSGLDPKVIRRFMRRCLRVSYGILATAMAAALFLVGSRGLEYYRTRELVANAQSAACFTHPDGTECDVFYVRTNFRGKDRYWEYHTCLRNMQLTVPQDETFENLPYATDVYINRNGETEHWTFGQEHMCWVLVRGENSGQEVIRLCVEPLDGIFGR